MGTPEIAVESLQQLLAHNYHVVGVVTNPDKPSGRGQQISESAIKQFALKHDLNVLQPENLSSEFFLEQIKNLQPDIIIVVAFKKIPDQIINCAAIGSFNLHASLLPQYRGAAPINWAIINGEKVSGITTFLLNNKIDEGNILLQQKIEIPDAWNASDLHAEIMVQGSKLVIKTVELLEKGNFNPINQNECSSEITELKKAPKIFKNNCRIDWNQSAANIHNFIRGLSYKPGAFTEIISPERTIFSLKILKSTFVNVNNSPELNKIETDNSHFLHFYCKDGYVDIKELQQAGKKLMSVDEFLRGFRLNNHWQTK
jgi:methionyl-tRNA formyltransferase